MPTKLARRLCPQAIVISGDYEDYAKYSALVTEVIADSVPLFEKASIDEFYVDLTGMDRFFGCAKFSIELKEKNSEGNGSARIAGSCQQQTSEQSSDQRGQAQRRKCRYLLVKRKIFIAITYRENSRHR